MEGRGCPVGLQLRSCPEPSVPGCAWWVSQEFEVDLLPVTHEPTSPQPTEQVSE